MLNNNFTEFRKDCLYIGKTSRLPSIPPSESITFLLVKDIDIPAYDSIDTKCYCIYAPSETNIWGIFNKIQDFFSDIMYISDCCNRIIQLSNNSSSLQKILDLGYELLGNPLLLVDASLNFVAHARVNTVNDESLWS